MDFAVQRVAIQGFGNVGSWAARELFRRGVAVIAVSDVSGGVRSPTGLNVPALIAWTAAGRMLADYDSADFDHITNEELISSECDVLIPAALGEVIRGDNADDVQASLVVEAANHPVTPEGDKVLEDRDVKVVPDILANAGGVTGSYFEWAQNIQQFRWKEDRFNAELEDAMRRAFAATVVFAERHAVGLRKAAFGIGIERVARAARLRGYV
jgi:glutamate dehydrogenase (NAD(P)+)